MAMAALNQLGDAEKVKVLDYLKTLLQVAPNNGSEHKILAESLRVH